MAASKIGNGVISLLWQLQCHCNHDHIKQILIFVENSCGHAVVIFQIFVYGDVVLAWISSDYFESLLLPQ